MTILPSDIKLLESERMTDNSDGGGRRRSVVIPDGVAGNVFPKVSRLDSVYGRVNLRKVYGAVSTANLDVYAGAHAAITDAPDNDRIHVNLFSTDSDFDIRTNARDRIESYVISGPESRMVLYGRQLIGQQALLVYQRGEEALPEIGEVFALSKEVGTAVVYQQYVRITDIEHELRTFTDDQGEFKRRVITLKIGAPLRYEFVGPETPSRFSSVARESKVRSTNVADAARYYGIKKLVDAVNQNDLSLRVASVYSPIVPTTQRETAVSLAQPRGANPRVPSASALTAWAYVRNNVGQASSTAVQFNLNRAIKAGSLQLRIGEYIFGPSGTYEPESPAAHNIATTDDGQGNLIDSGPLPGYGYRIHSGVIDYETGIGTAVVSFANGSYNLALTARYISAAEVAQPSHTKAVSITLATRGTVYSETLNPLPAEFTTVVEYRALGRWYTLRDIGNGELRGADNAYGTGSIDYTTGALVVTLGALPDIDSSIIVSWGSPVHATIRAGASSDAGASVKQEFALTHLPIAASSLTVRYTSGGVNYTATTSAGGVITGSGLTGTVNTETGVVKLQYTTRLPDASTFVHCEYNQQVPPTVGAPATVLTEAATLSASFSLANPAAAGSVSFQLRVNGSQNSNVYTNSFDGLVTVRDDGAGNLTIAGGQRVPGGSSANRAGAITVGNTIGTINYGTGAITLTGTVLLNFPSWEIAAGGAGVTWAWVNVNANIARDTAYATSIAYRPAGVSSSNVAQTDDIAFTAAALRLDLTTTIGDPVVPGSIIFRLGGKTYIDRNGSLYTDVNPNTGVGTLAGNVAYSTGVIDVTFWANGASLAFAVDSAATVYGDFSVIGAFFRTAGAPLRPASFYIQATSTDGVLLTGTSDQNGVITGTKVRGQVNQTMGVVTVEWGEMVTAAGNEAEPWYDADNVVAGQIFKPQGVFPSTIRYNAVVLSNLPLNADILGLDPVRLPSDGRVPIYRPADVVVIHNTKSLTLPNPVTANAVYASGRVGLADIWLVDQANKKVPTSQYTVDLLAGEVTMASSLTLTGLMQPLKLRHRQEELNLLADVQINGQLTLTQPLARNYDNTDTYVSGALLFGDMNARVTGLFDQATWTGVWSDSLIGSQATAQYNDVDYPIEVLNNGAVRERWRINFTGTTTFQVIGENLGVIGTGSTGADFSLVNPLTGLSYFTLRAAGWGSGWSVGNQLRFNTIGATAPIWIARTILPGATLLGDSFDLQLRGDVDE